LADETLLAIVTTRFPIDDTPYTREGFKVYYHSDREESGDICESKKAIIVYSREQPIMNSKDIFEIELESAWSESSSSVSGYKRGGDSPPTLREKKGIQSRLWEMCGENQPIAVAMLAGHAAFNGEMTADGWEQVCRKLVPDSSKMLTADGVQTVLSHCYNDMPSEIKTCCLYLSMYPMGDDISRKHLTRRWIAEGFVTKKQGKSEEDVAEEHFDHLIRRKFIRPVEGSFNWKVKNCHVNDLVHEFIVSKAREENFVTVVGGYWSMAPPSPRVRRLSLKLMPDQQGRTDTNGPGRGTTMGMDLSHVRSLTLYGKSSRKEELQETLKKCGIVQVLDLVGCQCQDLEKGAMKEICRMLLLKYLNLRSTSIKELPKDIGKLKHLETLDIRETDVLELPDEICQLQRLMRIYGGDRRKRKALKLSKKMKLKKMTSLRVLSGIEINDDSKSAVDLSCLRNLRKLAIHRIVAEDKIKALHLSIQTLYDLQTLIIEEVPSSLLELLLGRSNSIPKYLTGLELSGRFRKLPGKIEDLSTLTKLRLPVSVLCNGAEVLEDLGKLSTLSSLCFYDRYKKNPEGQAYEFSTSGVVKVNEVQEDAETDGEFERRKAEIFIKADGFKSLKLLRFFAPLVPQLSFLDKALPKLERLELRFRNFDGIYGIENLEALREIYLRVHYDADEFTKDMVENIAARYNTNDDRRVRILHNAY
jgi:disease resistance protein RPM1